MASVPGLGLSHLKPRASPLQAPDAVGRICFQDLGIVLESDVWHFGGLHIDGCDSIKLSVAKPKT